MQGSRGPWFLCLPLPNLGNALPATELPMTCWWAQGNRVMGGRGQMGCGGLPDSLGDVSATEPRDQGQGAEGGAGSRPRQGSPAGFSARMLPSCGDRPRGPGSRGTPPGPHWDPVLARKPPAPGGRSNWAQMALAEELAGLPHPGRPQSGSQEPEDRRVV